MGAASGTNVDSGGTLRPPTTPTAIPPSPLPDATVDAPFLVLEPPVVAVHAVVSTALAIAFTLTDANRFNGRLSPVALLTTFVLYLVWWLVPSLLGHLAGRASLVARMAIAAPTASLAMLLIAPVQNGSYTVWMYWNVPIVAAWTAILFVTTRPHS